MTVNLRYVVELFTGFHSLCWYRCGTSPNNMCVRAVIVADERPPFISSSAPVSNLILKVSTTGTRSKFATKYHKNLERRTSKYKKSQTFLASGKITGLTPCKYCHYYFGFRRNHIKMKNDSTYDNET